MSERSPDTTPHPTLLSPLPCSVSNRDLRAFQQDAHQHASQVCSGGRQEAHHRLPQLDMHGSARQQRERHRHRGEGPGAALHQTVHQVVAVQRSRATPARDGNPYLKPLLQNPLYFYITAFLLSEWRCYTTVARVVPLCFYLKEVSGSGSASCDYAASACRQELVLELAAQVQAMAFWCSTVLQLSLGVFFYLWMCSQHSVRSLGLFCPGYQ